MLSGMRLDVNVFGVFKDGRKMGDVCSPLPLSINHHHHHQPSLSSSSSLSFKINNKRNNSSHNQPSSLLSSHNQPSSSLLLPNNRNEIVEKMKKKKKRRDEMEMKEDIYRNRKKRKRTDMKWVKKDEEFTKEEEEVGDEEEEKEFSDGDGEEDEEEFEDENLVEFGRRRKKKKLGRPVKYKKSLTDDFNEFSPSRQVFGGRRESLRESYMIEVEDEEEEDDESSQQFSSTTNNSSFDYSHINPERLKQIPPDLLQPYQEMVELTIDPEYLERELGEHLTHLIDYDLDQYFYEPVTDDIAPGYSFIITQPMNFRTMTYKLSSYLSFQAFDKDVRLICDNCTSFNEPTSAVFEAAVDLRGV